MLKPQFYQTCYTFLELAYVAKFKEGKKGTNTKNENMPKSEYCHERRNRHTAFIQAKIRTEITFLTKLIIAVEEIMQKNRLETATVQFVRRRKMTTLNKSICPRIKTVYFHLG